MTPDEVTVLVKAVSEVSVTLTRLGVIVALQTLVICLSAYGITNAIRGLKKG